MVKVSVITINFNNSEGLRKTLDSVAHQHFPDYEYIVIDGGSTDGSKEIIEKYQAKIAHWVSESDCGIYDAMNKGIGMATGEYVHFLNSGDYYASSDVLSSVFSRQYTVPFIRCVQICDYGDRRIRWTNLGNRDVTLYDMYVNTMLHQATFIHRSMFEKYGLYDENLKIVFKSANANDQTTVIKVGNDYYCTALKNSGLQNVLNYLKYDQTAGNWHRYSRTTGVANSPWSEGETVTEANIDGILASGNFYGFVLTFGSYFSETGTDTFLSRPVTLYNNGMITVYVDNEYGIILKSSDTYGVQTKQVLELSTSASFDGIDLPQ